MARANKPFAVSIQWGGGMHYFVGYFETEKHATQVAAMHLLNLLQTWKAKGKKGARPYVEVWARIPEDRREKTLNAS